MAASSDGQGNLTLSGSSNYTCLTCCVVFHEAELQRAHYKSDWHRYNLKRKVANMPPVTADEFQVRVLAARDRVIQDVNEKDNSYVSCQICKKHFSSQSTFETHLKSKKHRDATILSKIGEQQSKGIQHVSEPVEAAALSPEEDDTTEEAEVVDDLELSVNNCLFCSHNSVNLESNLRHMTRSHSLYIPNVHYLANVEGFLEYLCEKIVIDHECLYCNGKGKMFHSLEAVKNHMVDKGHCKFPEEENAMLEYSEFYDFSSSYPDHTANDKSENITEGLNDIQLSEDGMELILPNGNRIGHRSLKIYYQQRLRATSALTPSERRAIMSNLLSQYKMIGWNTTTNISKSFLKRHNKVRDLGQKMKLKELTKLGTKGNKLQTHFRSQIDFK